MKIMNPEFDIRIQLAENPKTIRISNVNRKPNRLHDKTNDVQKRIIGMNDLLNIELVNDSLKKTDDLLREISHGTGERTRRRSLEGLYHRQLEKSTSVQNVIPTDSVEKAAEPFMVTDVLTDQQQDSLTAQEQKGSWKAEWAMKVTEKEGIADYTHQKACVREVQIIHPDTMAKMKASRKEMTSSGRPVKKKKQTRQQIDKQMHVKKKKSSSALRLHQKRQCRWGLIDPSFTSVKMTSRWVPNFRQDQGFQHDRARQSTKQLSASSRDGTPSAPHGWGTSLCQQRRTKISVWCRGSGWAKCIHGTVVNMEGTSLEDAHSDRARSLGGGQTCASRSGSAPGRSCTSLDDALGGCRRWVWVLGEGRVNPAPPSQTQTHPKKKWQKTKESDPSRGSRRGGQTQTPNQLLVWGREERGGMVYFSAVWAFFAPFQK